MIDCEIDIDFGTNRIYHNDICCLCLDDKCDMSLVCCKNKMHSQCRFDIFLKGMYDCPLCRVKSNPNEYFTINDFYNLIRRVDIQNNFKRFDDILIHLCNGRTFLYFYHKCCIRLIDRKDNFCMTFWENIFVFSIIILFYFLVFFLVIFFYPR